MKKEWILLHYLPCSYFIICAAGMLWGAFNYSAIVLLLIFGALLFIRRFYARLVTGGLMMFLSIFMFLALADEVTDLRAAGKDAGNLLLAGSLLIGGSFIMSILLLVPLSYFSKEKRGDMYLVSL
ncbi:hypothetical protein [Chitinophaga sp. XS-30]|uniref:hypothetical protein n=1 Tax=Chitinophaga sp. XS-30 TaxID=2604421 RepID=UPI0011DCACC9|nr:hypothetical protein [Chitinophaga sp. XS-30]QEH40798.1 hypothetical protein FW415_07885 [Chitinophaga sp. XS-30]